MQEAQVQIERKFDTLQNATLFVTTLQDADFEFERIETDFEERYVVRMTVVGDVVWVREKSW